MTRHRTGPAFCTVCGRLSVGMGLCGLHRRRLRQYGTTDLPPGIIHRGHPIGNALWNSLSDEPTYAEEYLGSIESLYALYQIHYRKPRERVCIDCGDSLGNVYKRNGTHHRPALRCQKCQDEDNKYPRL